MDPISRDRPVAGINKRPAIRDNRRVILRIFLYLSNVPVSSALATDSSASRDDLTVDIGITVRVVYAEIRCIDTSVDRSRRVPNVE